MSYSDHTRTPYVITTAHRVTARRPPPSRSRTAAHRVPPSGPRHVDHSLKIVVPSTVRHRRSRRPAALQRRSAPLAARAENLRRSAPSDQLLNAIQAASPVAQPKPEANQTVLNSMELSVSPAKDHRQVSRDHS
ncbi:putative CASP-like protein 4A1 [Iris pallida]|uniref:CASP-like protein 4A1 n=1 Tax=Iris pallida TaxID=29817 RepID=A0AAX6H3Z2_IRIPA|nr:putative CASP-like protein 4A1 [Iris pallida]